MTKFLFKTLFVFSNIIKEKREIINKSRAETDKLKLENAKRTLRLPQFRSKVGKIEQVTKQHLVGLEQHRLKVNHKLKSLSNKRKEYLQELSHYIFPVEFVEIQPHQEIQKETCEGGDDVYDAIMAEMEDAMSTSYIHGRWVTTSMTDG